MIKIIPIAILLNGYGSFDPPARFDHPNANINVQWRAESYVRSICGGRVGCSMPTIKPCRIIVMHGSPWGDDRLLRHEIGHCNGWPKDHPQ